jgi:RNA polymerase sigma factor (TIGR02999 family)
MPAHDVTALLRKRGEGDGAAAEEVTPLVYSELLRLARRHLRMERECHSLRSTELVHEAYLRMVNQKQAQWQDRAHFFAVSANIMRHILVDHARARLRGKRGGGATMLVLDEKIDVPEHRDVEIVALAAPFLPVLTELSPGAQTAGRRYRQGAPI